MSTELLDIHPRELKFLLELKKQSSCSVQLVNKSNSHVAFKVKTTSPKKYCVRPNIGIIRPKSVCDFTVTMQAQKLVPPEMICKDKFLVQSTVVSAGTTDDDVTSSMFAKDNGRYVEEVKLRVILLSPPNSPVLSPIKGIFKQEPIREASTLKDHVLHKVESFTPQYHVTEDVKESKMHDNGEVKPAEDVRYKEKKEVEDPSSKDVELKTVTAAVDQGKDEDFKTMDRMKDVEDPTRDVEYEAMETLKHLEQPLKSVEYESMKEVKEPENGADYSIMNDLEEPVQYSPSYEMKDTEEAKLVKDIEKLKSKLNVLESKLTEAEVTISKLTEEMRWTVQERESLIEELASLRSKRGGRKVQVGYPFLFLCMVALVSIVLGYRLHG